MEPHIAVLSIAAAMSAYVYYFVSKIKPRWDRLVACLPLLPILGAMPWFFSPETQPATVGLTFWILTWLGGFKVLAFCFNRGTLAESWNSKSFFRFFLALSLPLHIKPSKRATLKLKTDDDVRPDVSNPGSSDGNQGTAFQESLVLLLTSLLQGVLFYFNLKLYSIPNLPLIALEFIHCLSLLLFMSIICDTAAAVTIPLANIEVENHFDKPYISRSFRDFWGKRWNVAVSTCLRQTIYEPVVEAVEWALASPSHAVAGDTPLLVAPTATGENGVSSPQNATSLICGSSKRHNCRRLDPAMPDKSGYTASVSSKAILHGHKTPLLARILGVLATFLVSGIMHELVVFYVTLELTGEMTLFFMLHGLLVSGEAWLRQQGFGRGIPRVVKTLSVVLTTFLTAHMLFFPPFIRTDATTRVITQVKSWLGQMS